LKLCSIADVPEGQARGFKVAGLERKVVVFRKGGRVFGYLDSCPHYEGGTPMAWRTDRYLNGEGTHLACHSHGALFDVETGECVLGPCLGQSLTKVPVRISAFDEVELQLESAVEELA
jgi:nitrite reductase/ring-hydroxylating ferredoxin subunit